MVEIKIKEKPILFSTAMVAAILEGRKTQTRRVIKPQPSFPLKNKIGILDLLLYESMLDSCPYGKRGNKLWVRETWGQTNLGFVYKADYANHFYYFNCNPVGLELIGKWKPSIHMPRKACRLPLQIINVRIERLQDISEEDAIAEGIKGLDYSFGTFYRDYQSDSNDLNPIPSFQSLWQSINGVESWESNPFVWVLEFERVNP